MRIAIRVDASRAIGTGHVRRMLTLATELRDCGAQVRFVTRDLGIDVSGRTAQEGFETIVLPAPDADDSGPVDIAHGSWAGVAQDRDAEQTAAAINATDWLIIDHYGFDARWHRAVKALTHAKVAVIDDLADRFLDGDVIVDHNYAPEGAAKFSAVAAPGAHILIGPSFALIDRAYRDAPRHAVGDRVDSIGVFLGGIDAPNFTAVVLDALARFKGTIEVVTTSNNPHLSELARRTDIHLSVDLPNLAAFFGRHAMQIGAGGGAIWERCCIGAPTLCLIAAENQRLSVPHLDALGAVRGYDMLAAPDDTPALAKAIDAMIASSAARRQLSEASTALVDGWGAARVAATLMEETGSWRAA